MTRILRIAAAALAATLAASAVAAQTPTLTTPTALARGNAALPRIATPATLATGKINAGLAKIDAVWRAAMRSCGKHGGPSRTVTVAMAGPSVLSVVAKEELDCGAYPDEEVLGFAYDLTSGRPLDWMKLLPASLSPTASVDTDTEGTRIGAIASPRLRALYLKAFKADGAIDADIRSQCADDGGPLADDSLAFQLWPDAKQDAVVAQPFGLPHVAAACQVAEPLPTADLRRLGVDSALLNAIDAAHAGR